MGNLIENYIKMHNSNMVRTPKETTQTNFGWDNKVTPQTKLDSATFLEMYANLKPNKDLSLEGCCIDEGKINNQDACIKTVYSFVDKTIYREGSIGGKKLELITKNEITPEQIAVKYKGKYNNKDIDLTLAYPRESKIKEFYNKVIRNRLYIPDNLYISGSIDNKPYSLALPNTPVPRDTDIKDIITVIMNCNSFCPGVFNGNIVAVEPGKSIVNNWERKINKRQELYDENIKPLVSQTLSTVLSGVLGVIIGKTWCGKVR